MLLRLLAALSITAAAFEFRFDVRIGTRASPLAIAQAEQLAAQLSFVAPDTLTALVPLEAGADKNVHDPISKVDFTKELDSAVLRGELDLAVHSLKDIPPQNRWPAGLDIACHLPRLSPLDVLVGVPSLSALPSGARVGTSSVRRQAQLRAARPDLTIVGLRGTVGARLAQLECGDVDALVLAMAGLERLALQSSDHVLCELPPDVMLPGAGQGIVCATCREDGDVLRLLRAADDPDAHVAAAAERALLDVVDGASPGRGRPPIGALMAREGSGDWKLRGMLAAQSDGTGIVRVERSAPMECSVADAVELGREAGTHLLAAAAAGAAAAAPAGSSVKTRLAVAKMRAVSGPPRSEPDEIEDGLVREIQAQRSNGEEWNPGMVAEMQGELTRLGLSADELRAAVAAPPRSGREPWGTWSQSADEICFELCVGASTSGRDIRVECLAGFLDVRCKDEPLLSGRLALGVRATELDWTLDEAADGERALCIVLPKRQGAAAAAAGAIFSSLRVCGEEAAMSGLVAGADA